VLVVAVFLDSNLAVSPTAHPHDAGFAKGAEKAVGEALTGYGD